MSFKFSFSNVRKLISSGLDECPIASVKATRDQSCQLSRFRRVTHDFVCFLLAPHIQLLTQKKQKKHDLGPSSFLFKLLDGADGVYGWLHPEVSDRRRDTPKDNERNDHLEKSDDESELRLGQRKGLTVDEDFFL